ncbi:hypothetical protein EV426DRAFT_583606 [Tirmania nivea]|nr:hypothetical protein EV426DRAFT_583606 [Tirmania nivea]
MAIIWLAGLAATGFMSSTTDRGCMHPRLHPMLEHNPAEKLHTSCFIGNVPPSGMDICTLIAPSDPISGDKVKESEEGQAGKKSRCVCIV